MLKREDISDATEHRFWAKVRRGARGECWTWTGAANSKGYGCIGWGRRGAMRMYLAHRVSFVLSGGHLDPALTIDHTCGTRRCVNPAHLEQVDCATNTRRAVERKYGACEPKGHTGDISPEITPEEVRKILYSLASPARFELASPT